MSTHEPGLIPSFRFSTLSLSKQTWPNIYWNYGLQLWMPLLGDHVRFCITLATLDQAGPLFNHQWSTPLEYQRTLGLSKQTRPNFTESLELPTLWDVTPDNLTIWHIRLATLGLANLIYIHRSSQHYLLSPYRMHTIEPIKIGPAKMYKITLSKIALPLLPILVAQYAGFVTLDQANLIPELPIALTLSIYFMRFAMYKSPPLSLSRRARPKIRTAIRTSLPVLQLSHQRLQYHISLKH